MKYTILGALVAFAAWWLGVRDYKILLIALACGMFAGFFDNRGRR